MKAPEKIQSTKDYAENLLYGKQLTFILPSGFEVTIREQNGADDDIISNTALAQDLTSMDIFLSSLILNTNLPFAKNGKLSKEGIKEMALRDRYYIIFMSRIHSMGEEILIRYNWGEGNGGEVEYEENLREFIWDFSNPFPEEGSSEYKENYIKPYLVNPYEELDITLASGKVLKFKPLNGHSEKQLLKLGNEQTRNSTIKARGLKQLIDDQWLKVENFITFSKRDMAEIHNIMRRLDPNFTGLVKLENPITGEIIDYPIMADSNFFYPEVI